MRNIPSAADAGVDLGFEDQGPLQVRAEPLLLAEALQNLISNAILHTGRGTVVTVRVRAAGDAAILEVEDDGPGIPEPARDAALGRFARGRTHGPGMGLGLPVVDEIARLFAGRLRLEAGPGDRGLIARLSFPMMAKPADPG